MAAPVVRNGNVVVNSIDFALSAVATLALLQINLTGLKKIGTVAERAFDAFLRIAHFDTSVQDSNAQYAASFIPQWFRNQFAGSRPYDAAQEVVVNGKRVEVYTEGNKHHQLIISGLVMCATTTLIFGAKIYFWRPTSEILNFTIGKISPVQVMDRLALAVVKPIFDRIGLARFSRV
jgi:hypothetical protein